MSAPDPCPWADQPRESRPWWARIDCAGPIVSEAYGDVCTAHRDAFRNVGA